jgi:hypothetical protein
MWSCDGHHGCPACRKPQSHGVRVQMHLTYSDNLCSTDRMLRPRRTIHSHFHEQTSTFLELALVFSSDLPSDLPSIYSGSSSLQVLLYLSMSISANMTCSSTSSPPSSSVNTASATPTTAKMSTGHGSPVHHSTLTPQKETFHLASPPRQSWLFVLYAFGPLYRVPSSHPPSSTHLCNITHFRLAVTFSDFLTCFPESTT